MGFRQRILTKGKEVVMNPQVMRLLSDDRVMKAAEGVLDARVRLRAAWTILKNGHELPSIDPALIDGLGEEEGSETNGASPRKVNGFGSNGHSTARITASVANGDSDHPPSNGNSN